MTKALIVYKAASAILGGLCISMGTLLVTSAYKDVDDGDINRTEAVIAGGISGFFFAEGLINIGNAIFKTTLK